MQRHLPRSVQRPVKTSEPTPQMVQHGALTYDELTKTLARTRQQYVKDQERYETTISDLKERIKQFLSLVNDYKKDEDNAVSFVKEAEASNAAWLRRESDLQDEMKRIRQENELLRSEAKEQDAWAADMEWHLAYRNDCLEKLKTIVGDTVFAGVINDNKKRKRSAVASTEIADKLLF